MGIEFAVLCLCKSEIRNPWPKLGQLVNQNLALDLAQLATKVIAFQWIFAFTIMAVLFVATVGIAVPAATGKDFGWRRQAEADTERAPLLHGESN